jgi:hypothetical protein
MVAFASGNTDMTTLFSTRSLTADAPSATPTPSSKTTPDAEPEPLTSISISPTLNIGGKPAAVLPMSIIRTDWAGRDATDVAACLSGALLTARNVSLLVSPAALAESDYLKNTAKSLAGGFLPLLFPQGGSAAVFTSSMYKGGLRLSAREFKASLFQHYESLVTLPSCLRVPSVAAHRVRVALSNVVGMTTSTANVRGGALDDFQEELTATAELAVEVDTVVNAKYRELCAGIEGSSIRLRFAGFSGMSSLAAAAPTDVWVYAAVAKSDQLCDESLSAE